MLPGREDEGFLGRVLRSCCDACAIAGGAILLAMAAMTTASVAGRAFFSRPLLGDIELVQLGTAVCIALFLPYTQLRGGNIIVDLFTQRSREGTRAALDGLGTLLYTLVMAVVAWRLAAGAAAALESQEASMLMNFPLWVAYAAMVPGLALAALVGAWHTAWHWRTRLRERRA